MVAATEKKAHTWVRDDLDWYVEEPIATEKLARVEKFVGSVWDPCCGQGNIVKALLAAGYDAHGTDIVQRADGNWFVAVSDFLGDHDLTAQNIVMNPPFFRAKGAEAFIRRALAITKGKVCAFVDVKFLAGGKRANGLYLESPPDRIWILTPRVSCPPGEYLAAGNKAEGGTADWCWLVWDNSSP